MDGLKALAMVIIGIMIYIAFRFEWKFSVAAIVANLHDVVIILGFFAFFQWEFSLAVLAAVLAVLGYSVNESVVVFDRIRENFQRIPQDDTRPKIIDHAITSTMSRTIITHASTEAMVLSMLLFGGPSLHYFALALTIGILLRHLFLGVRCRSHCHVAGGQTRRPGQGHRQEGQGRPVRPERGRHRLTLRHATQPVPM